MNGRFAVAAAGVAALLTVSTAAHAQLDNRPYQFRSAGSVGMSEGYRQAIINEQLTGETPRFFVRDAQGSLVDVVRGPGRVPLIRDATTGQLTTGRHRGAAGFSMGGVRVGGPARAVSNEAGWFGLALAGDRRGRVAYSNAAHVTSDTIDSWTTLVTTYDTAR